METKTFENRRQSRSLRRVRQPPFLASHLPIPSGSGWAGCFRRHPSPSRTSLCQEDLTQKPYNTMRIYVLKGKCERNIGSDGQKSLLESLSDPRSSCLVLAHTAVTRKESACLRVRVRGDGRTGGVACCVCRASLRPQ